MQMRLQSLKISAAARERVFDSEMFYYFFTSSPGRAVRKSASRMFTSWFQTTGKKKHTKKNRHEFTFGCKEFRGRVLRMRDVRSATVGIMISFYMALFSLSRSLFRLSWTTEKYFYHLHEHVKNVEKCSSFFNVDKLGLCADCVTMKKFRQTRIEF